MKIIDIKVFTELLYMIFDITDYLYIKKSETKNNLLNNNNVKIFVSRSSFNEIIDNILFITLNTILKSNNLNAKITNDDNYFNIRIVK